MREVHYFQRFSKREDVVTNNTLLLFRRLQSHSAVAFEELLKRVTKQDRLKVGARLSQQDRSVDRTIADGMIRQGSFQVVVETKLHASFDAHQLDGHLSAFEGRQADVEVLLLLSPQEPVERDRMGAVVSAFNASNGRAVQLAAATFREIGDIVATVVPEHEVAMREVLDDYIDFCAEADLLQSSDADMLVVSCAQSLPENIAFALYYDSRRSHVPAKVIGFYKDKAVQAIASLERVVQVNRDGSTVTPTNGPPITEEQQDRIIRAMDAAPARGWDISRDHYFFLAGPVVPADFWKVTKYPLRSRCYINLREALDIDERAPLPEIEELARLLSGATW